MGSKLKPTKDLFYRRQSGSHALHSKKALDNHSYLTLPHPSFDLDAPDDYMRSPIPRTLRPSHEAEEGRTTADLLGTPLAHTLNSELKTPTARRQDRIGEDVSGLRTPRGKTTRLFVSKERGQLELGSGSRLSEQVSRSTRAEMTAIQPPTPGDAWVDRFSSVCHINCDDTSEETGDTAADPKASTSKTGHEYLDQHPC